MRRAAATAAVLLGVCRQHGNDVRAFTFAPPPLAAGPPSSSPPGDAGPAAAVAHSSSSTGLRSRGGGGSAAGIAAGGSSWSSSASDRRVFPRKHATTGPLSAAAGDGGEEEGEWRRFGSGRFDDEESEDGGVESVNDPDRVGLKIADIVNPFKKAFDAGQSLRSTFADTLGQITGTASPVSRGCVLVRGLFASCVLFAESFSWKRCGKRMDV